VSESSAGDARVVLGAAYVTNYGALASSSPFIALHLAAVGFSPTATAQILAGLLLIPVVAIPGWTFLADRTNAIGRILRIASLGALVVFAALLFDPAPVLIAVALGLFAICRAPFGALLDTLVLRDAVRSFGAVRSWGTLGYAVGAFVTGAVVSRFGSRAILHVTSVLLVGALVAAMPIDAKGTRPPPARKTDGEPAHMGALLATLLKRPRVVLLFAIAVLQEMGLAPYDALFAAYLTKISGAAAAGFAVTLGAGAEWVFLLTSRPLVRRLGPERLLLTACVASVVRWGAIAFVVNPVALVAVQVLHSFSFGAYYMSAVMLMDRETPPALRASGQGLFGSFSFAVCASIAVSLAGVIEPHRGMRAVFGLAAAASAVAAVGAAFLSRGAPARAA